MLKDKTNRYFSQDFRRLEMSMAKQIYYHNLRKANIKKFESRKTEENYNIKNKTSVSYGWILILVVVFKIAINLSQI